MHTRKHAQLAPTCCCQLLRNACWRACCAASASADEPAAAEDGTGSCGMPEVPPCSISTVALAYGSRCGIMAPCRAAALARSV